MISSALIKVVTKGYGATSTKVTQKPLEISGSMLDVAGNQMLLMRHLRPTD